MKYANRSLIADLTVNFDGVRCFLLFVGGVVGFCSLGFVFVVLLYSLDVLFHYLCWMWRYALAYEVCQSDFQCRLERELRRFPLFLLFVGGIVGFCSLGFVFFVLFCS